MSSSEDFLDRDTLVPASASHALCHYFEFVFPAMTMFIARDLGQPANKVIASGFLLYLFYGLFALPWGFLADKSSSRSALGIGLIGTGLGAVIVSFSESLTSLSIGLAVIGVGISSVHPAAMALITKAVSKRGKALGVFGVWGSIGITFAPLIGGVGGYFFGWRNLYLVSAAAAIGFGAYTLTRNINEHHGLEADSKLSANPRLMLACFCILLGCMTFAGLNYRGNSVTLPIYIEERAEQVIEAVLSTEIIKTGGEFFNEGNDKTLVAGLLFSVLVFVALFGQLVGGWAADRFDLRFAYLGFFSFCLPILILMGFASNWSLLILGSLFFFFSLGMQPIENSLVAALTPHRLRSTAYGIKFVLAFGLGSLAVWMVTGVREVFDTGAVYFFLACIQAFLLITIVVLIAASNKLPAENKEKF